MFPVIFGALGLAAAAAASENNRSSYGRKKRYEKTGHLPPSNFVTTKEQQLHALSHHFRFFKVIGNVAIFTTDTPVGSLYMAIWPDAQGNYPTKIETPSGYEFQWTSSNGLPLPTVSHRYKEDYKRAGIPLPPGFESGIDIFVMPEPQVPAVYGGIFLNEAEVAMGEAGLFPRDAFGAQQSFDMSDEAELDELGPIVHKLDLEIEGFEDEIAATVPAVAPSFGFVWTILGIAGIISMSKRIEGKLNHVQRRINRLARRVATAERHGRTKKTARLMDRVDAISSQIDGMVERFTDLKEALEDEGIT